MTNAWLEHVKKFRAQNPELSYKDALKEARQFYTPLEKKAVVSRAQRAEKRGAETERKMMLRQEKLTKAWDLKQEKEARKEMRLRKKAEKEAEKARKALEKERKMRQAQAKKIAKEVRKAGRERKKRMK